MTATNTSGGNSAATPNDEWAEKDDDYVGDRPAAGAYLQAQQNLIFLIDEYRETHPIDNKKMTLSAFAEHAGISFYTIKSIVNGHRWVAKANRTTIEKLASILEIPVIQVFILCEFIKPQDIVYVPSSQDETLNAMYRMMIKDKQMMYRCPVKSEWDKWDVSAKISLCMMYELVLERSLLRYATTRVVVE